MKKFGFYKYLTQKKLLYSNNHTEDTFEPDSSIKKDSSKMYAYKMLIQKHEAILKNITTKNKGEKQC